MCTVSNYGDSGYGYGSGGGGTSLSSSATLERSTFDDYDSFSAFVESCPIQSLKGMVIGDGDVEGGGGILLVVCCKEQKVDHLNVLLEKGLCPSEYKVHQYTTTTSRTKWQKKKKYKTIPLLVWSLLNSPPEIYLPLLRTSTLIPFYYESLLLLSIRHAKYEAFIGCLLDDDIHTAYYTEKESPLTLMIKQGKIDFFRASLSRINLLSPINATFPDVNVLQYITGTSERAQMLQEALDCCSSSLSIPLLCSLLTIAQRSVNLEYIPIINQHLQRLYDKDDGDAAVATTTMNTMFQFEIEKV